MLALLVGCYSVTCGPGTKLVDGECVEVTDTDTDTDGGTTDTGTPPPEETADPLGPARIDGAEVVCVDDELVVTATVGSADAASLYYLATGEGAQGWEAAPEVRLGEIDEAVGRLDCDFFASLTFALRIYTDDQVGGALADCVAWGDDPAALVSGDALDNLCVSCTYPSRPEELAGCRILP